MSDSEFFKGVKQWEFEWQGRKAKLPVFYYDNLSLTAIFTGATGRVKRLLPHPEMRPVELYPGRCLVAFTAFEYRKTDIDAYNEVSVAFFITFGRPQVPGLTAAWQMARNRFTAYVWQLPVTTEIARVGGVDLYGYPKFIAEITFRREGGWVTCDLAEGGQSILSLGGKELPTGRGKLTRVSTYSIKDGIPLVANVCQNPIAYAQSRDRSTVRLELGSHRIASDLQAIELSRGPILYQYCPQLEAILFAGRNLLDR
jgi:hypothetical protein